MQLRTTVSAALEKELTKASGYESILPGATTQYQQPSIGLSYVAAAILQ